MIDFSDQEEIKRWLGGIKPARRRREVAVALAARAAMRVLPILVTQLRRGPREQSDIRSGLILSVFRAVAVPWAASRYPTRNEDFRTRASNAAYAATRVGRDTEGSDLAAAQAARAAEAASSVVHAVLATDIAYAAHAAFAAAAACAARIDFDSAFDAAAARADFDANVANAAARTTATAIAADATAIESGRSAAELAGSPLWPGERMPDWAVAAWPELKLALLSANEGWEVWTDWYGARLAGDARNPPNDELEIARATIPDEIWRQGPAAVNAEIKRLFDLHTPKKIVVSAAAFGVETLTSVGDVLPTIAVPLQGAEPKHVVPNPAPPPNGWMNAGDDPAVQLAARTRLQAGAALETAFTTQPPFLQSRDPSAGSAPQFIGGTTPLENPPPIETIPSQERAATQFRADAQGRIDVVRIPPTTDELQRFHYDEMRRKARALAALGQMLGDVASPTNLILEALPERMEDASVDKLWSRANTLRRRHDAHVRAIENNLGPNAARLDDLVAATLGDLVDSFNVYVLGDPRALELDSARLGPQDREAVRKVAALAVSIARAASEPQSPATPAAQEALAEQVGAAIDAPDDINGDQAADLARKTTGNFVSELLRRAYAPIAKLGDGVKKEAGFAQHEFRAGFYRAAGAGGFVGVSGIAAGTYAYWPEISSFVVRNADALKAFVSATFHNPKLVEIIDLIVQATRHLG